MSELHIKSTWKRDCAKNEMILCWNNICRQSMMYGNIFRPLGEQRLACVHGWMRTPLKPLNFFVGRCVREYWIALCRSDCDQCAVQTSDVCKIVMRWRFKPRLHDTTCCQTRCQTGCQTALTNGCIVYTAGCQFGLYNRFDNRVERTVCSFNTVVQPVVKPVWQPV